MDSQDAVFRLRNYMSLESEFCHTKFMKKTKELVDVDELHEVIDMIHANYLVHRQLFKSLAKRAAEDGYELPPLREILGK